MESKVSIIVPCYNQAQYLPEALESVLNQTYPLWECIIVNDGSPDNTEKEAKKWCKKDNRFVYLEKENGGLSSARNAGIGISAGEYILPLDADDKIGINYLKEAAAILDEDETVELVYAEAEYFDARSGRWELPTYDGIKSLALRNMIYCSAFFRKSNFEKFGPFDESFQYGREDWDLWISILKNGGKVVKLPDVHFFYRKKETFSMIDGMNDIEINGRTAMKIFIKHHELYLNLFGNPIELIKENSRNKVALEGIKKSRFYRISNYINGNIKRILP